jgi:hypothetical protein
VSNECCQVQDNTPQISSAISERLVIARWVQDKIWWLLQMLHPIKKLRVPFKTILRKLKVEESPHYDLGPV